MAERNPPCPCSHLGWSAFAFAGWRGLGSAGRNLGWVPWLSSCYAIPERRHPEGCHHGWRGVRGPRVRVEEICPCQSARRSSQRRSGGYVWRMVGGWVFATLPKCGHEVVDCTAHYIREMLLERKHKHKGRYQHERKHPSFAHPHAHTHLCRGFLIVWCVTFLLPPIS